MAIPQKMKTNIKKAVLRTKKARLSTAVVLQACCYIDGLGNKLFTGGPEYHFKKYIEEYMPHTFALLRERSRLLKQKDDFCLHALWRDIRCGLVHEIDPKSPSAIAPTGKMSVHLTINDKRWPGKELVLCSPRFTDDFLNSLGKI